MKTLKNILIPAGSEVGPAPVSITRYVDYVSVIVSHGPDHTSEWAMPKDDAIALGIVAEEA